MLCNYVLKNAQQVQQVCVCSLTLIGSLPVYIGLFIPNGMRKTIGFDNFPSISFLSGEKNPNSEMSSQFILNVQLLFYFHVMTYISDLVVYVSFLWYKLKMGEQKENYFKILTLLATAPSRHDEKKTTRAWSVHPGKSNFRF